MIISRSEKILLSTIAKADAISLIKLRSSLGWEISRFAEAFISLEQKGLVVRSGATVKLSGIGGEHFSLEMTPDRGTVAAPYRNGIEAPQLDVSRPYLPNYQRFIAAKAKSLYTGGASVVHPE